MTTIAWDGKILAADKRGDRQGLKTTVTKIWKLLNGEVFAVSGSLAHGVTLKRWYCDGADPATYPEFQKDKENSSIAVVAGPGGVRVFAETPDPVSCEEIYTAWGSGRDFAIGAMACGKTAAEAIEVASQFDIYSGGGVDAYEVQPVIALVRGG